ncbi:efflux RND transporter permease subunit [Algiphilus sp.]|uniref:efflux RND transporter permease subunit n=1 Tax=Algiphilus sp. TaxID=1872431 RepID=UPI003B5283DC
MAAEKPSSPTTEKILDFLVPLIYGKRLLLLLVLIGLTVFFGYQTAQVRPDAGFDKSIPLEHPYMEVYKQYEKQFGGANQVLVALIQQNDEDIYNEKFLGRLKEVTDEVFFLEGVDRSRVSSLFTPDVRYLEVVEGGFQGGNVIPADYQPTEEMFETVRNNVARAGIVGRYTTKDQTGAMIYAELVETDPVTGEKLNYSQVADSLEQIREKYEDDEIKVHIIGFAKVVGNVTDATLEVAGFFLIALIGTALALWWYTGSAMLATISLVSSIIAVIWEFGLLHSFGFGLDPFAILVPFLILAVSTSHGVQYTNTWADQVLKGMNGYDASVETFRRLAIPGTIALITDMTGFLTIQFVPIDIVREMSWNAAFGMMAVIITNKVLLPIWLSYLTIKDQEGFAAQRQRKMEASDKIWRPMTIITTTPVAGGLLVLATVVLGASIYLQQNRIIGDADAGVPELRPDSRYNQDSRAIARNFEMGTDILRVVAETDPEACIQYDVMEQIDRFGWHMRNVDGVQSTVSLPQVARQVNAAFSEANPMYSVLPRNRYTMVQAITPVPTSSGLLNPDCSAMAVLIFTEDHKAETIERVLNAVERFDQENAETYFKVAEHDVDMAYCDARTEARREIGRRQQELRQYRSKMHAQGLSDVDIEATDRFTALTQQIEQAEKAHAEYNKTCPVNFALASGNVGVMGATNEVVHEKEFATIFWVYVTITIFLLLSYQTVAAVVAVVTPLLMVTFLANALMAIFEIGLKTATLPVVALAVGIGVDYGIYIYDVIEREVKQNGKSLRQAYLDTLRQTGKAVVFTGVCLSGGVATWLFSDLQFQRDMGLLLVFMFSANMLGAVLLCPALCRFVLPLNAEAERADKESGGRLV